MHIHEKIKKLMQCTTQPRLSKALWCALANKFAAGEKALVSVSGPRTKHATRRTRQGSSTRRGYCSDTDRIWISRREGDVVTMITRSPRKVQQRGNYVLTWKYTVILCSDPP